MSSQNKLLALLLIMATGLVSCSSTDDPISPSHIIVVNPEGTGEQPTIQAAINVAESGNIIELQDGTYYGIGNYNILINGIAVIIRSQSSDPGRCVINCEGDASEGRRGFTINCHGDLSNTTYIDGITVLEGYQNVGGGIRCDSASIAISNCIFKNNTAMYQGSTIECSYSNLSLRNCKFIENTTILHGGTLSLFRSNAVSIDSCLWADNITSNGPSGIMCYETSQFQMTESTFINNKCAEYYGVLRYHRSSADISGCTIANNVSRDYGSLVTVSAYVTLNNSTICQNGDDTTIASIYCSSESEMEIKNSIIAFSHSGCAVKCTDNSIITVSCSDLYGHPGGDWTDTIADQQDIMGNISEDPLFTDLIGGDYSLDNASPCGIDSSNCGVMGAWLVPEKNP